MNNWLKENNKKNRIRESYLLKSREGKKCPVCKIGTMIRKEGKFGEFLGCSKYPNCKHSAPLTPLKVTKKKKGFYKKGKLVILKPKKLIKKKGYGKCNVGSWD